MNSNQCTLIIENTQPHPATVSRVTKPETGGCQQDRLTPLLEAQVRKEMSWCPCFRLLEAWDGEGWRHPQPVADTTVGPGPKDCWLITAAQLGRGTGGL